MRDGVVDGWFRKLPLSFLLAAAAAAVPGASAPPEDLPPAVGGPVEEMVVTRVRWPVLVEPRRNAGDACKSLSPDDFVIEEAGRPVAVKSVDRPDGPLLYAFLVDTSGSMTPYLDELREELLEFSSRLRHDDRVMLAVFADELTVVVEPTTDRSAVQRALHDLPKGTRTILFDAVREFVAHVEPLEGRRVVVVITDGGDTASRGGVVDFARLGISARRDLRICCIVPSVVEDRRGAAVLSVLAQSAGGRYEWLPGGRGIGNALRSVRERMGNEVIVAYAPRETPPSPRLQRLRVKVDGRPGLPCRVREALRARIVLPADR